MERNDTIDFIKFFAMFLIVFIHASAYSSYEVAGINGDNINFIFNLFARVAVPYFFAVSGYFLGQKLAPLQHKGNYLKKYLWKNGKSLITWSLFFFLYDLVMTALKSLLQGLNMKVELSHFFASVFRLQNVYYGFQDGTAYHLWFLIALLWSVLILFIFIKWNKVRLLFWGSLFLHLLGLFGQSYSAWFQMPVDTRDALFFGLFYITLGYCFSTYSIRMKGKPRVWLGLFLFCSLLEIAEGLLVRYFLHQLYGNYYLFTIPTTITLLLFALTKKTVYCPFINKAGANAVGIYMIHPLFISLSYLSLNFFHLQAIRHTFIWNLLFTPFIFIISYYSYQSLQVIKGRMKRKP